MELIADYIQLKEDHLAKLLIAKLQEFSLDDSFLYYNFPFYRGETQEDLVEAHVLFTSKKYGVVCFRCLNDQKKLTDLERKKINDLDSHIFSRLNKIDDLRIRRRELKINITPILFVPQEQDILDDDFVSLSQIKNLILSNEKEELSSEEYLLLTSAIEGTVHLRNKKDRDIVTSNTITKGEILNDIQNQHAAFDLDQKRAALNIIDSPQRIRGLAGSGKTIILTMKVALYHLKFPESEILYTYFTKSLYGQIRYLIEKYYRDFSDNREPNWKKIHILHGWGGFELPGVYSTTCKDNQIAPISYINAKRQRPDNPFDLIFSKLASENIKEKYDLTLIDEGQDFSSSFYKVCRKLTRHMRIVWAYDDFQNIFNVNIQDEKETFGKDEVTQEYYVDFSRDDNKLQDIVLRKCYRNPRLALIHAFSLGLGIYNDKVLQRLENNNHWADLGFDVEVGDSTDGCKMVISRSEDYSPVITNEYFKEDSVRIKLFDDLSKECQFVCQEIYKDIKEQNLRPDDISVICLDAKNIGVYFEVIEGYLSKYFQIFNILKASNSNTNYTVDNHITLSTLNKAKGNESGMVYIVGTDSAFHNKDYIIDRNKIFTAITRTKGWVVLTGFSEAKQCENEMLELKENKYKLIFTQPSVAETKTILRGINVEQSLLNDINIKIVELTKHTGMTQEDIFKLINGPSSKKS
jgi:superfamily I DNA and RNA helicase